MKLQETTNRNVVIFSVFLILFAAGYRIIRAAYMPDLPNFSPVMAMAFCGGLFLPWRLAASVVFGALIVSDLWVGIALGLNAEWTHFLFQYPLYALAIAFGAFLRTRPFRLRYFYAGVLLNAIVFYLVTNTGSWMANPYYAKTIAGWFQALTTGVPGYPPTWTFFRNTLFSDMMFSSLLGGVWFLAKSRAPRRKKVRVRNN